MPDPVEVRTVSSTGGMKATKEQRAGLVPGDVFLEFSEIYGIGAVKYDDNNWRKGYSWHLSIDAALRHLQLFNAGEDYDICKCDVPTSEFPCKGCGATNKKHVLQAAWHCFTLAWYMIHKREFDDRAARFDEKQNAPELPDHVEHLEFYPEFTDYMWTSDRYGYEYKFVDGAWLFLQRRGRWMQSSETDWDSYVTKPSNGPFTRGKRVAGG